MSFEIFRTPFFKEQYQRLPEEIKRQTIKVIRLLAANPRHPSLQTHKIEGTNPPIFEAYVNRKYRLTFDYQEGCVRLRNVDNHDEALANP